MSLVMTLTLLPALSTPAEAITASEVNYADGPNWFSIDKGGGAHERLSTLSMLLRYRKGNTAANAANGIDDAFASYFDPHYSGDTMYIRLDYDIEVEFDVEEERSKLPTEDTPEWYSANWHCNLPVYGKKVLDLNGHTVKVWAKDGADCAFEIRDGATLTVVDSKGGGKMLTDTYIYGVGGGSVIDLFHVQNGGELILNAPDAEFESGRSKVQTYYGYAVNGHDRSEAGILKVRGQSNGTAVVVEKGGSLTVAGGILRGRGYSFITKWGNAWWTDPDYQAKGAVEPQRCAAITAKNGASVHIIDGEFIGKGGADALQIEYGASPIDLTIESGAFDVSKVDRLALPSATNDGKWIDGEFVWTEVNRDKSNYMDGKYGVIGIPKEVLTAVAEEKGSSVDIIQGGHSIAGNELDDNPDLNTYNDSNAVTIRPLSKDEPLRGGSHVQLSYENGNENIDPVNQTSFNVTAAYKGYYSNVAKKLLASDYRPRNKALGKNDVEHYYEWKFDLYNYNKYCYYGYGHPYANDTRKALYTGTTVSAEPQITVDLLDLTKFTQDDWKKLENGDYIICCEVTEVWKGEHTYKLSYYNDILLRRNDRAAFLSSLMKDGFEPRIDICHTDPTFNNADGEATTAGLAQYLTCGLDEETQIALDEVIGAYEKDYLLSLSRQEIQTEYEIFHYGSSSYSWWERYGQGLRADLTWDWPDESDIGPLEVLTRLWVPEWRLTPTETAAVGTFRGQNLVKWRQYFLYLPAMTVTDNGTKTRVGFDRPVELPEGGNVQIEPNKTGWLAGFKEKNPGTVTWQWYKSEILGLDSSERSFWRNVEDGIYIRYDTDDKTAGSVVLRNSGTYRLVMTYTAESDGKARNFVSVPIEVHGKDTPGLSASLYSPNPNVRNTEELKNANLLLQLKEGAWNQVDSISLRMMEAPAGIKRSTAVNIPVVTGQRDYRVYLEDFDGFAEYLADPSKTDPAGEYTFRATIKGKNGSGYSYTIYSGKATMTLQKAADTYALVVNNQYLGAGTSSSKGVYDQQVPLYLDSSKDIVTLDLAYYPQNATYDTNFEGKGTIKYEWFVAEGSSIMLPTGASKDSAIRATILRPGTSIIGCTKTAGSADAPVSVTTYFKVCVPITEVEVTLPDYQNEIGKYYRDVLPTFVARSASGATVPDDYDAFNFQSDAEWYRTEYAPSFATGTMTGVDSFNKKVTGNDKGRVTYTFQLHELDGDGLSFPLKESYVNGDRIEYEVDLSAVKLSIRQADGTTVTMSAAEWGAQTDETFDTSFEQQKPHLANFTLGQDVFVEDPAVEYINTVSITTTEPHVGDPVNEQITVYSNGVPAFVQPAFTRFKKVDVVNWPKTEKGTLLIFPYSSQVNKADSTTAGEPYTDASGATAEKDKSFAYLQSATYEAGTYYHDLQLQTSSDPAASDGKVHCFAPDVKVFLNGKLLDFGGVTYDEWGYSTLSLSYFFNVTVADYYEDITLDDITPKQGEMPADEIAVKETDSSRKLDVNVKDVTWFVDSNKNGKPDTGEEAMCRFDVNDKGERTRYNAESSTLWYDGSFLPGVAYSVQLKLEPGDHTTRFTYPLTINCGGRTRTVSNIDDPIVLTFDADYTIYTIALQVASDMRDRDPWKLFNASNSGCTVSVTNVRKHNTAMETVEDIKTVDVAEYLDGADLQNTDLEEGRYWLTMYATQKTGFRFSDDVKVRINGSSKGGFYYGNSAQGASSPYRVNDIVVKKLDNDVRILHPFSTLGAETDSVTVSGTVTSYGSATDTVTVRLMDTAYQQVLTGNSASYSFIGVPNGTYTMQVTKKNHVTESVTVTVSGTDVTQNVTLSLLGDVNGDNKVTVDDLVMLARHVAKIALIKDDDSLRCADVTRDGNVTVDDLVKLARYVAKIISSFD